MIDSGSRDASLAIAAAAGAEVLEIPPADFGHGRTRNLGAERTSGELVAFLTQDATPVEGWLRRARGGGRARPARGRRLRAPPAEGGHEPDDRPGARSSSSPPSPPTAGRSCKGPGTRRSSPTSTPATAGRAGRRSASARSPTARTRPSAPTCWPRAGSRPTTRAPGSGTRTTTGRSSSCAATSTSTAGCARRPATSSRSTCARPPGRARPGGARPALHARAGLRARPALALDGALGGPTTQDAAPRGARLTRGAPARRRAAGDLLGGSCRRARGLGRARRPRARAARPPGRGRRRGHPRAGARRRAAARPRAGPGRARAPAHRHGGAAVSPRSRRPQDDLQDRLPARGHGPHVLGVDRRPVRHPAPRAHGRAAPADGGGVRRDGRPAVQGLRALVRRRRGDADGLADGLPGDDAAAVPRPRLHGQRPRARVLPDLDRVPLGRGDLPPRPAPRLGEPLASRLPARALRGPGRPLPARGRPRGLPPAGGRAPPGHRGLLRAPAHAAPRGRARAARPARAATAPPRACAS